MFEKLRNRASIFFGTNEDRKNVPMSEMSKNIDVYKMNLGLNSIFKTSIEDIYRQCAPLSICIDKIAEYTSKGLPKEFDKNGKEIIASEILSKINNPNDFQTREEFISNVSINVKKYGIGFIYVQFDKASQKYNSEKQQFIVLNNNNIIKNNSLFSFFKRILGSEEVFKYNDLIVSFPIVNERLIPIFDLFGLNQFEGVARISEIMPNVANYRVANEGENILAQHPGGVGIITPEKSDNSFPSAINDNSDIEQKFEYFGGTVNEKSFWRFISTPLQKISLMEDYSKFGFKEIKESAENTIRKKFNVPAEIYGEANAKFTNLVASEKSFITNVCKPLLDKIYTSISDYYKNENTVVSDFSFMPCFAIDKKANAEELKIISETIKILIESGKQDEANKLTKQFFL